MCHDLVLLVKILTLFGHNLFKLIDILLELCNLLDSFDLEFLKTGLLLFFEFFKIRGLLLQALFNWPFKFSRSHCMDGPCGGRCVCWLCLLVLVVKSPWVFKSTTCFSTASCFTGLILPVLPAMTT